MVAHPPSGQAHIHTCNRNGEKRVQLKQILRAKKSWAQLLRSFFTWKKKKKEVRGTDQATKPCEPINAAGKGKGFSLQKIKPTKIKPNKTNRKPRGWQF